jgi:predicted ATPase
LWLLGYPDQALQRIHDALTLAQELAHPFSLAYALHFAAMLHAFRREGQATQERAEATLTLSTEQGFPLWIAGGTILWGWARAVQGQGEEGLTTIQQGLDALIMTGARLLRPYFLAALTEVYGRSEQATQGLSVVSEALTILEESGERWWEAELHRLKGELLLAQAGKERPFVEEAETCLYQAIEIARRQQAKSLELRAAMSLVVRFVSSL